MNKNLNEAYDFLEYLDESSEAGGFWKLEVILFNRNKVESCSCEDKFNASKKIKLASLARKIKAMEEK